ncbi:CoA ester lyase [Ancylobacter sp. MQZ15Z-1]|uniref:CoA ester lyase n=1 Tax=Ancylobacter mangrovi TaxID=2972472 RepID=A0A9X2PDV9_9HYPH|nr:CoA ester lyase [Ancylobacter mangrovi]MCS0496886.1 CoA ester lyase [Ancylobacter mangrovi]
MSADHPLRSVLYVPGEKARALEKARGLDVDALIIDLEDSIAPEMKPQARESACRTIAAGGYGFRQLALRVNPRGSAWFADDLKAAAAARPDIVVLPKVESPEDLAEASRRLDDAGAPPDLALWAMIETPLGLLNLREIAQAGVGAGAGGRLAALVLGTNDIAKDTGVQPGGDRAALVPWLLQAVLVARAYGLRVFDGVYNAFSDLEGFTRECTQGRRLGFDGKTLIHPSQITSANRVFAPAPEDVAQARAIVDAFARPENAEKGVITLGGQMVERLHAQSAARLLALDAAIRARESSPGDKPAARPASAGA